MHYLKLVASYGLRCDSERPYVMLLNRLFDSNCCLGTTCPPRFTTKSFQIIVSNMKKAPTILLTNSISLNTIGVAVWVKRLSSKRNLSAKMPMKRNAIAVPLTREKSSSPKKRMVLIILRLFTSFAINS